MPGRAASIDPSQLSLWSDAPPAPATLAPVTPLPGPAAAAAPAPAPEPTVPIAALLTPATFRHPRANRQARLDGHVVGYEFRRARRKTIGFAIANEGLVVSAPHWVPQGEVQSALQEKARWILKKLQEQDERARKIAVRRIDWRDGTSIPFLGEPVIVVLDPRAGGSTLHTATDTLPGVPRLTLHLGLPQHAEPAQIRDAVQAWLQRQARRVFEERCRHFAAQLGVVVTRLSLSSATTRWGSASADGAIRLHWRLIHFALPTIDYVVAHELAHLRVMDHSPRFWDVVRSVVPDVKRLRDTLRDEALPAFD
jgi:predicted metal-dependent hydrolase